MGLQSVPAYIASAGFQHPATLDRNLVEGIFGERGGALRAGQFIVSTGVGTRAVQVTPGKYHLQGSENAQQGGYFAWSDTADTFWLAAGVGNPRWDTLLLRIHDNQYGSIPGSPGAYWDVVQGVAAGSPTPRVDADFNVGGPFYVPGSWARIADMRVNVGDSSIPGGQISNMARYARMGGWTIGRSFPNWPSDAVVNDHHYETDTGFWRVHDGSTFIQAYPWRKQVLLSSAASEIHVTGIPSTLRNLRVTYFMRNDAVAQQSNMLLRVNNTTSTHAYNKNIVINATNNPSANDQGNTHFAIGIIPASQATAGSFGGGVIEVKNWNGANSGLPHFNWHTGMYGTTAANAFNEYGQGVYFGAGPYTSLRFAPASGNFVTGSWVSVEGWEAM